MPGMVTIRFWRGERANLPLAAPDGVPMWCGDTKQLFMGTDDGRVLVAGPQDDEPANPVVTQSGAVPVTQSGASLVMQGA